jgi:hypothetical protein
MAVEGAETFLLKLDRHHKAYEIKMQICCCKFEAMEGGVKRYRFKLADLAAIVDKLDSVDWCSLFSGRGVDQCAFSLSLHIFGSLLIASSIDHADADTPL